MYLGHFASSVSFQSHGAELGPKIQRNVQSATLNGVSLDFSLFK